MSTVNKVSWIFRQWFHSLKEGEEATPENINKQFNELKSKGNEPGPVGKSKRSTSFGLGALFLGFVLAAIGANRDDSMFKVSGGAMAVGGALLAGIGKWVCGVDLKVDDPPKTMNAEDPPTITKPPAADPNPAPNSAPDTLDATDDPLPKTDLEKEVDKLLEEITDPADKKNSYYHAREALQNKGEDAVNYLIRLVSDNDGRQQTVCRIIKALELTRSKKAVQPLINYLNDDDSFIVSRAVFSLGEIGDARAYDHLEELFKKNHLQGSCAPEDTIEALGKLGDKKAVPLLINALNSGEHLYSSAVALGRLKDPKAVDSLLILLTHDNDDVVRAVMNSLGEIRDVKAVDPLIGLLEVPYHSFFAAGALGKIGDPKAIMPLISHLNDRGRVGIFFVDHAMARALVGIGSEAVESLIDVVRSGNRSERTVRNAILVLGEIGDKRAVQPLLDQLSSQAYKISAIHALGRLGDTRVIQELEKIAAECPRFTRTELSDACKAAIKRIKDTNVDAE